MNAFCFPFDWQIVSCVNLVLAIKQLLRYSVTAIEYDLLCNAILLSILTRPSMFKRHRNWCGVLLVPLSRVLSSLTFVYLLQLSRQPFNTTFAIETPTLDCTSYFAPIIVTCNILETVHAHARAANVEFLTLMLTHSFATMLVSLGIWTVLSSLRGSRRDPWLRGAAVMSKCVLVCATWTLVILYCSTLEQAFLAQQGNSPFRITDEGIGKFAPDSSLLSHLCNAAWYVLSYGVT